MTKRSWAVIVGVTLTAALAIQCFPASQPIDGIGLAEATELSWKPWHRRAYAEVATCLGYDSTFPRGITLYAVDGFTWWVGLYVRKPLAIYVRRERLSDTALFKHEFVHHLEWPATHGPLFREAERCGFTPHEEGGS